VRHPARTDYGPQQRLLERWVPDEAARRKIEWDTPSQLFGFAPLR
jgi:hypothetical protein